jgi:predicted PurR-regulated permease PerM
MSFTEKDAKRIALAMLILFTAILAFIIVKPVLMSVLGGLILAYIFFPVYTQFLKYTKYRTIAASVVTIFVLAVIFVPLWFLAPVIVNRVFNLFQYSQSFDSAAVLSGIFPDSGQLVTQASLAINNAIGKVSSVVVNAFVDFLVNFAVVSLHLFLVAFVFFFALRDEADLRKFVSGLSPLRKKQENDLIKQFKDITNSIIYGQIIVGIFQGIAAGIGLWLFGVPNAFLLTVLALILSIIPVIGPGLLYVPVTVYMIITGNPFLAIGYLLYNLLIVSALENILRAHIVQKKAKLSQVIALIGMIGGLLVFGVLGLILGPLILAYFVTFLRAYKEDTLSSFFAHTR